MTASRAAKPLNSYQHLHNFRVDRARSWPYALRIYCSACATNETIQLPRGYIFTCLQSIADNAFKKKGWAIGRNRKQDVCPACVKKEQTRREIANAQRQAAISQSQTDRDRLNAMEAERRRIAAADRAAEAKKAEVAAPYINAKAVTAPTDVAFVMENRARPQTAPLGADQARIERKMDAMPPLQAGLILARLRQVFRENGSGYIDGWHDDRLAKELAVSALWVVKVRTDNFPGSHTYDPGAARKTFAPAVSRVGADAQILFDDIDAALAEARHGEARLLALAAAWRDRRLDLEARAAQIESRQYALENRAKELASLGASTPIVATPLPTNPADPVGNLRQSVSDERPRRPKSAASAKAAAVAGAYAFRSHPLYREGARIINKNSGRWSARDESKIAHGKALQKQAFDEFKSGKWTPASD